MAEHGFEVDHSTVHRWAIKLVPLFVKQDHRAIKPIAKPMMGFKGFRFASIILHSIETMHRIRKGQMKTVHGNLNSLPRNLIINDVSIPF